MSEGEKWEMPAQPRWPLGAGKDWVLCRLLALLSLHHVSSPLLPRDWNSGHISCPNPDGSHLGLKIDSYVGNESRMSNAGVPTMSLEAF